MTDAGICGVMLAGVKKGGAGGANLSVSRGDETYCKLQPSVKVGGEWALRNGMLVRPYISAGFTQFLSNTSSEIQATMESAPVGVEPFRVTTSIDRTYADVSAGVDVLTEGGVTVKVGYVGRFSDNTRLNGGQL